MSVKPEKELLLNVEYENALQKMVDYLQSKNPDLVIGLGESVYPELHALEKAGFAVKQLNTEEGRLLYQRGTADEQADRLHQVLGDSNNPLIVEDTVVAGGKLYQLRNTFIHAGIEFQAVVLAAQLDQVEEDIEVISTNQELLSLLNLRAEKIREKRTSIDKNSNFD